MEKKLKGKELNTAFELALEAGNDTEALKYARQIKREKYKGLTRGGIYFLVLLAIAPWFIFLLLKYCIFVYNLIL